MYIPVHACGFVHTCMCILCIHTLLACTQLCICVLGHTHMDVAPAALQQHPGQHNPSHHVSSPPLTTITNWLYWERDGHVLHHHQESPQKPKNHLPLEAPAANPAPARGETCSPALFWTGRLPPPLKALVGWGQGCGEEGHGG